MGIGEIWGWLVVVVGIAGVLVAGVRNFGTILGWIKTPWRKIRECRECRSRCETLVADNERLVAENQALAQANASLKKKVAGLVKTLDERAKWEPYVTARGGVLYRYKAPENEVQRQIYACANCFRDDRITLLQWDEPRLWLSCTLHGRFGSDNPLPETPQPPGGPLGWMAR